MRMRSQLCSVWPQGVEQRERSPTQPSVPSGGSLPHPRRQGKAWTCTKTAPSILGGERPPLSSRQGGPGRPRCGAPRSSDNGRPWDRNAIFLARNTRKMGPGGSRACVSGGVSEGKEPGKGTLNPIAKAGLGFEFPPRAHGFRIQATPSGGRTGRKPTHTAEARLPGTSILARP